MSFFVRHFIYADDVAFKASVLEIVFAKMFVSKAVIKVCCTKTYSEKVRKIRRRIPVPESISLILFRRDSFQDVFI